MNGAIVGGIVFISGIIGMICDLKFGVKSPKFYWTLGVAGGFLATIVGLML